MKSWEIINTKSHGFQCADYTEALQAVKTWWDSVGTETSVINVITFNVEDDLTLTVEVFYAE